MPVNSRQRLTLVSAILSMFLVGACSTGSSVHQQEGNMSISNKQKVFDLLKSIETGDSKPVAYINPEKYVQHNLAVADGLAGLGAVLQLLPKGSARVNTMRVFEDGEFVFAHSDYNFFGPKIGFDVFRFEAGRIVEHWDNLQEKPAAPNPSGRSMIDGPTTATDLGSTTANKALVKTFVEEILVNGRMDKLSDYIQGENYLQHNPRIADGLLGLGTAIDAMAKAGITMKYDRVHRVLGEGSFVLTVSEGSFAGKHVAFYDLFRVQNNTLVEHWDTIEEIPERAHWKNDNGKF